MNRWIAAALRAWICVLALAPSAARADVVPGETVDKSSWQKVDGLVPDFILEWVKNGDLTMKIGQLDFDPQQLWSKDVRESWDANKGRYAIDDQNGIVDATTRAKVRGVQGLPFPEVDPADPTMPIQLMWNRLFMEFFLQGPIHEIQHWFGVTRRGLEKTLVLENLNRPLDPARFDQDYAQITAFRQPFNMSGTGSLALSPLHPSAEGIRYAFTPELRRVKRLAYRISGSDVHFGLDNAPDDSWAGGPKYSIEEGTYRLIGERDALIPYARTKLQVFDWNADGELAVGANAGLEMRFGFDEPGSPGAPWHPLGLEWVKTRVWVIESRSKDPSYVYGPCEGWVVKGTYFASYKRVTDTSGKLWKGVYFPALGMRSRDGNWALNWNLGWMEVDMRRDHGSAMPGAYRKGTFRRLFAKSAPETLFTRAGFTTFVQ